MFSAWDTAIRGRLTTLYESFSVDAWNTRSRQEAAHSAFVLLSHQLVNELVSSIAGNDNGFVEEFIHRAKVIALTLLNVDKDSPRYAHADECAEIEDTIRELLDVYLEQTTSDYMPPDIESANSSCSDFVSLASLLECLPEDDTNNSITESPANAERSTVEHCTQTTHVDPVKYNGRIRPRRRLEVTFIKGVDVL
ncbi:uncharacterized protein FOMMEDRAFT_146483 [Fomitiporia mediterranea MF3/22]|uniref:uncharacterized protein n=1 Tax=Fomitiporia mediterranea (strain MF3/22) TaxID=694068 RepID=UPI00044091BB|nr:uncharacterized protein FOMMEDRAFT_146483 [Fomitiporia mediterranea MF3/22]EJD04645.1 hypothetical protein FOMMEDRAFT_146483 [Fomitiporia mediterranea MF3/22]